MELTTQLTNLEINSNLILNALKEGNEKLKKPMIETLTITKDALQRAEELSYEEFETSSLSLI